MFCHEKESPADSVSSENALARLFRVRPDFVPRREDMHAAPFHRGWTKERVGISSQEDRISGRGAFAVAIAR
jgi:hypothetical protein